MLVHLCLRLLRLLLLLLLLLRPRLLLGTPGLLVLPHLLCRARASPAVRGVSGRLRAPRAQHNSNRTYSSARCNVPQTQSALAYGIVPRGSP